jgi:hypothetical protein
LLKIHVMVVHHVKLHTQLWQAFADFTSGVPVASPLALLL